MAVGRCQGCQGHQECQGCQGCQQECLAALECPEEHEPWPKMRSAKWLEFLQEAEKQV